MRRDAETNFMRLGLRIFFVGFILIILGVILTISGVLIQSTPSTTTSYGGVVFIGPFPIVFGAGPQSPFLIAVGLVIAVLIILIALLMRWPRVSFQEESTP